MASLPSVASTATLCSYSISYLNKLIHLVVITWQLDYWKFLSAKFHEQAASIRIQKYSFDCLTLRKSSFWRILSFSGNAGCQWLLVIYQLLNICRSKYAGLASSSNVFISVIAWLMTLEDTVPFSEGLNNSSDTSSSTIHRCCLYCHPVDWNRQVGAALPSSQSFIQQSPFLCFKVNSTSKRC